MKCGRAEYTDFPTQTIFFAWSAPERLELFFRQSALDALHSSWWGKYEFFVWRMRSPVNQKYSDQECYVDRNSRHNCTVHSRISSPDALSSTLNNNPHWIQTWNNQTPRLCQLDSPSAESLFSCCLHRTQGCWRQPADYPAHWCVRWTRLSGIHVSVACYGRDACTLFYTYCPKRLWENRCAWCK